MVVPDITLLQPGDVITAINGQPITPDEDSVDTKKLGAYVKFDEILQASHGSPINLTIKGEDGKVRLGQFQPHFADPPFTGEFNLAGMLPRVAIAGVSENSPLIGWLHPNDVVKSIHDADPWPNPSREVFMKRVSENGKSGHPMDLVVLREGNEEPITLTNVKACVKLGEGRMGLSVQPVVDELHTVVADVMPGSAADHAGLKGGDTLTSIDGKAVTTWYDVQHILAETKLDKETRTASVKITYTRPQVDMPQDSELKLGQEALEDIQAVRYQSYLAFAEFNIKRQTSSPVTAAGWGVTETRDFILQFYLTLRRMADRSISPSNMMGPVGIFVGGKAFAYKGIDWLLWFLSMISANLAVVNFLPIPVVDGGQFMFLIFEKIKGKPLSARAMAIAQYAGLAFLAAVVLFVTYNDIFRMVG